jgi:hypothetical protein
LFSAGSSIPARIAMIAITTSSSMSVKHMCFIPELRYEKSFLSSFISLSFQFVALIILTLFHYMILYRICQGVVVYFFCFFFAKETAAGIRGVAPTAVIYAVRGKISSK